MGQQDILSRLEVFVVHFDDDVTDTYAKNCRQNCNRRQLLTICAGGISMNGLKGNTVSGYPQENKSKKSPAGGEARG